MKLEINKVESNLYKTLSLIDSTTWFNRQTIYYENLALNDLEVNAICIFISEVYTSLYSAAKIR